MSSNISSLIDVYRMEEIDPKTRAKIIHKLGMAIDDSYGMSITPPIVYQLVKLLDPENQIFQDESWNRFAE
jgi:myosin-crossreactive antigen